MVRNSIKRLSKHYLELTFALIFSTFLAGCGGSSSSGSTPAEIIDPDNPSPVEPSPDEPAPVVPSPIPGTTPSGWKQGIFTSHKIHQSKCVSPRSGFSPITEQRYPDVQGTLLDELNWLRSWSNDVYLWYDEIQDQDPSNLKDTESYFKVLKSQATTSTGKPKDAYHYAIPSPEWEQQSTSGASYSYGAAWIINNLGGGNYEIIAAYVEPNTPASNAGFTRGTKILIADGVSTNNISFRYETERVNEAIYPTKENASHTFTIKQPDGAQKTISMQSKRLVEQTVLNTKTINTNNGKIGYLTFNSHLKTSETHLINAINQLKSENITDLVLDLRYNSGGLLAIASQLGYMIAGQARTESKAFENLIYNDKYPNTSPFDGSKLEPTPFFPITIFETYGNGLPSLNLSRVFVLTTSDTCSASEALMNGLEGINVDIIQIGSTTCGKPYGFRPVDNCSWTYMTINFMGTNEKGFGDYPNGFAPNNSNDNDAVKLTGCYQTDDLSHPLGDSNEAMLKTALYYQEHNQCPSSSAQGLQMKFMQPKTAKGENLLQPPPSKRMMNNKFMLNMP